MYMEKERSCGILIKNWKVKPRMTFHQDYLLDETGWRILQELQQDAKLSFHELGRRGGLSSPAVTERVRKLEDAGIIIGYGAKIDPTKEGLPTRRIIRLPTPTNTCP